MEPILSMMQRDQVVTLLRDIQRYLMQIGYKDNRAASLCREIERVLDQLMGAPMGNLDIHHDALEPHYSDFNLLKQSQMVSPNTCQLFGDSITDSVPGPMSGTLPQQRRRKKKRKSRKRKRPVMVNQFHTHIHYHNEHNEHDRQIHIRQPHKRRRVNGVSHSQSPQGFDDDFNCDIRNTNNQYIHNDENAYYLSQALSIGNVEGHHSSSDLEILARDKGIESMDRIGTISNNLNCPEQRESSLPQSVQEPVAMTTSTKSTTKLQDPHLAALIDEMHANTEEFREFERTMADEESQSEFDDSHRQAIAARIGLTSSFRPFRVCKTPHTPTDSMDIEESKDIDGDGNHTDLCHNNLCHNVQSIESQESGEDGIAHLLPELSPSKSDNRDESASISPIPDHSMELKSSDKSSEKSDGEKSQNPSLAESHVESQDELPSVPQLEPMQSVNQQDHESETSIDEDPDIPMDINGVETVNGSESLHSQQSNELEYVFEQAVDRRPGPKFYSMFMYYDTNHQRNILIPDDDDDVFEVDANGQRITHFQTVQSTPRGASGGLSGGDSAGLSECFWWNKYFAIQFPIPQFEDPKIGRIPRQNPKFNAIQCGSKPLCYRYPPVFESWDNSPKSAPYPYLVKERVTTITDTQFLRKALVPFWNQNITLTTRPRQENFGKEEEDTANASGSQQEVVLKEVFRVNGKYGLKLLKWCQECKLDEDISVNEGEGAKEQIKDIVEDDALEISIGHRLYEYMPFTVGDIYLGAKNHGESPRKFLKFDLDDPKALQFMSQEHDLLRGEQLANMHIATYGARTPWHHDLGLCSWLQILYGEKNVKIWDVQSSKLIEECKNNESLSEQEKEEYIAAIHPKWSCWLRPGITMFMPSGCGHLVTTTSNCAVMVTGSFVPYNQVRIGYEMAKYEDKGYLKSQDLDWDKMVTRLTANVFGKEKNKKKGQKKEKIKMEDRLKHLETATEQTNWNMEYTTITTGGGEVNQM